MQIFLSCKFFCTNLSNKNFLEILQPLSEAATGGVPSNKLFLNICDILQQNTCVGVSFLVKSQAFKFEKRLQHRKKGTVDETKMVTCCVKDCSNQSKLNKNISYHKILGVERKDIRKAWIKIIARPVLRKAYSYVSNSYIRGKPQLLEKVSCKSQIKNRKYFSAHHIKIRC